MSPYTSILLRVLGDWGDEAAISVLSPLSDADWNNLVQESISLQVAPLLYRRLKQLDGVVNPPPSAIVGLRSLYMNNSARGLASVSALSKILRSFHDEELPVILIKGIYLSGELYGDIGLRMVGDVDLMVRESDYWKAQNCIEALQRSQQTPLPHIDTQINIAGMASLHKVDIEGVWRRARAISIGDAEALVPAPEDTFLALCLHHFFRHAGQLPIGIRAFCDVSAILDRYQDEMDWEEVKVRAEEWGVSNCVSLALRLTRDLLNATVPPELDEVVRNHDPGGELQAFARDYFSVKQAEPKALSPYLLQFLGLGTLKEKNHFIVEAALREAKAMEGRMRTHKFSARFYWGNIVRAARLVWLGIKLAFLMVKPNARQRKLIKLIRWMT